MIENAEPAELIEHWQIFLQQNPDARIVVDRITARTGLAKDEVLFFLMDAWTTEYLLDDQPTAP